MEVIEDKTAMREWSRRQKREFHKRVALVPTMGYLHDGHLSLVREAKKLADEVVVSIYVNPTQFGPTEDFSIYPRDLQRDLSLLEPLGVAAVFHPQDMFVRPLYSPSAAPDPSKGAAASYPAAQQQSAPPAGGHETWVTVKALEQPLCGAGRPGHFRGVATVVAKLLHCVEPDVAVFGRKDFQQWRLLHRMARDLDMGVEIVGVPLVREADGLAMSSRNVRLTAEERRRAVSISQALAAAKQRLQEMRRAAAEEGARQAAQEATAQAVGRPVAEEQEGRSHAEGAGEWRRRLEGEAAAAIEAAGGQVEYVQLVNHDTLQPVQWVTEPAVLAAAARFGSVRLIDNVEIP